MMAAINLIGPLNLIGNLTFKGDKLTINHIEALVPETGADTAQGMAPPVLLPPPPAGPTFPQPLVWIVSSFNATVMQKTKPLVALGMCMQGQNGAPWPGMMLPSIGNNNVMANGVPINVLGDQGVVFPSGGTAIFSTASGQ